MSLLVENKTKKVYCFLIHVNWSRVRTLVQVPGSYTVGKSNKIYEKRSYLLGKNNKISKKRFLIFLN